jgi:hypothetical protein
MFSPSSLEWTEPEPRALEVCADVGHDGRDGHSQGFQVMLDDVPDFLGRPADQYGSVVALLLWRDDGEVTVVTDKTKGENSIGRTVGPRDHA